MNLAGVDDLVERRSALATGEPVRLRAGGGAGVFRAPFPPVAVFTLGVL